MSIIKHDLSYLLALHALPSFSVNKLFSWLDYFSDIETLFKAPAKELKMAGLNESQIKVLQRPNWQAIEEELAWANEPHHHLISIFDVNYPFKLKHIKMPPLLLYVCGNKEALQARQLAIVGTRHPTPVGSKNAAQFAAVLAEQSLVITSGLALGIDAAAHRGALSVKGITIGICGTGLARIYPKEHRSLVDEIVDQQGAIISEFPLQTPPKKQHFPQRNRLIAGLSEGVLVVEAALKSGSLITAKYALDEGREVFAIPGSIHNPLARGCHYLLKQGAKLVESAIDILEEFGQFNGRIASLKSSEEASQLSADQQKLLEKIDYESTSIDNIILRSGLTAGEVSSMLLILELQGYIQIVAGGYIRIDVRGGCT